MFERVIILAQQQQDYVDLVNYLLMARKSIKDSKIDSELIYAYARGGERFLPDLESFVTEPN
jgi:clathrin heavy chain